MRFLVMVVSAAALWGAEPVRLAPTAQKFRTFHDATAAEVPAALKSPALKAPVDGVTDVAVTTDGAVWYGTGQGLVRWDAKAGARDRYQYFAGRRYLSTDAVERVVPDAQAGVWVRTARGVSHIELRRMTLAQKAALFEERIRLRHDRHGMVSPSRLTVPGDLASSRMRDDDNDGLWTGVYAAAECYRFAVTGSTEAQARAKKALEAMLFLEQVAGSRGFPARSYIEKGEPMPTDGEWHWTEDGKYYWKGDTSSDEIVGHMYAYAIAYDLLPDAALKKRIAATTRRIMDHILANGYYLIDLDGKPTRWGKWSRKYFDEAPGDSALNSLELLSFLKVTAHITGDAKYEREYRKAAVDLKYAEQTARYRELHEEINYSDEELAMLPFYCLFRYEKDAALLDKYYRPALDQWWANIQREDNPLWTLIYLMGRPSAPVDLRGAVRTLYRQPVDLITWTVTNSHRSDVVMSGTKDRFQKPEAATLLPPDERPVMKWNANPFIIDSNGEGRGEDDGAAFLLPYWFGRYQKMLAGE
ncbi:hypothetical protein [uncultured Paludibaculum sp.]|uniref:hypothetical protein n=1 Tax=uncultured Paludibaculum sp. TaxID=1765020 RepID=UPI002AAA97D1|nr:hypothetical protein [uncultured Paludibaculum sp.]